jgi:hypothetical protein
LAEWRRRLLRDGCRLPVEVVTFLADVEELARAGNGRASEQGRFRSVGVPGGNRETVDVSSSYDLGGSAGMAVAVGAAAVRLELTGRRVRQLLDERRLAGRKVDGRWLVEVDSLERFEAGRVRT